MSFRSKYILLAAGAVIGAIAGYMYYRFAGCQGTCTITSKPFNSTGYGALMGALLFSLFKKENSTNQHPGDEK